MATTSNLYAEKVFAEHPIGLWALDEDADYVSLLSEGQRSIIEGSDWLIGGAVTEEYVETLPAPIFDSSVVNLVTGGVIPEGDTDTVTLELELFDADLMIDNTINTVSVSTYLYPFSKQVTVEIGISYSLGGIAQTPKTRIFQVASVEQWAFISEMFEIEDNANDISLLFNVSYTSSSDSEPYSFLVHGITFGQLSEQFNVESLGSYPELIETMQVDDLRDPSIVDGLSGIRARAYGLLPRSGYYLTNSEGRLTATNSSMPMVFGAKSSTRIIPNGGNPSLVVPGLGFLSSDGQYSDLTMEMWLKVQSNATQSRRIFGPISSTDGLYVNDSFLILKIGTYTGSYYVAEWDRPMLVAIRTSSDSASVVINGEEVIAFTMVPTDVSFPSKFVEIEGQMVDQDWVGFYAYEDVPQLFVDCIGVYSYIVPTIVEKRRWVYGQGVETPENIIGSSIGSSVAIDYTVANYAKNYSYPDLGRFQQGINENLLIEGNAISLPKYNKPTISFNDKTIDDWYADVPDLDDNFGTAMSLKPNSSWDNTDGYILFPNINLLSQDLKAFYGLFESNISDTSKQVLMYVENEVTNDSFEISLEGSVVSYTIKTSNLSGGYDEEVIYSDSYHVPGDFLLVGLNIPQFVSAFSGKTSTFFGTKQELKFYVGGTRKYEQTFSGKIYRVGFCTARNLQKISFAFTELGVAAGYNSADSLFVLDAQGFLSDTPTTTVTDYTVLPVADGGDSYFGNLDTDFEEVYDGGQVFSILVDKLLEHVASYTLVPKVYLEKFILDIAVNGYWQDYVPLSYFAKYVTDGNKDKYGHDNVYLDVDFIQFNVSYPQISKFLSNHYDTSKSIVRTYVSFQILSQGSDINLSSISGTESAPKSGVVTPGSDWRVLDSTTGTYKYKRYEVVNDTIIYPPDGIDFNLVGLAIHVEVLANGLEENPVKIRSIQLASQALNAFVPNAIGTKYGALIYPYRKSAEYYDYKGRNPFSIYKGNTPYLYLTSTSGLRLRGLKDSDVIRGLSMPINKNRAKYYKVAAWQMALRFDDETFPEQVTEIFEIEAHGKEVDRYVKFYMIADDTNAQRGKVYAINGATGLPEEGVTFYINGRLVKTPVIDRNSWTMLGVVFNSPIEFSVNGGAIRVTGPITFNNVSHYQVTAADEAARSVYRKWSAVKAPGGTVQPWTAWSGDSEALPPTTAFTWKDVLFVSEAQSALVDGTTIFEKYTGTDHFIVDSGSVFRTNNYKYSLYDDIIWSSTITTPV